MRSAPFFSSSSSSYVHIHISSVQSINPNASSGISYQIPFVLFPSKLLCWIRYIVFIKKKSLLSLMIPHIPFSLSPGQLMGALYIQKCPIFIYSDQRYFPPSTTCAPHVTANPPPPPLHSLSLTLSPP